MPATTKKKAKSKTSFKRKKKVIYDRVRFTLPEIFEDDAEFNLPNFRQIPNGVQRRLRADSSVLLNFLADHVTEAEVEAIDSLHGEENQALMEAWAKASGVDLGKSSR